MPPKLSKIKRLLTLAEDPLGATFDEIEKLDERVTELETLPQLKGDTPVAGIDFPLPRDGRDYILTTQDKDEIASKITVPIVEKVVEKTETIIKEQPIITQEITNEIKEVAITDTAEQIRDKLETLKDDDRLDKSAVKGLDKLEKKLDYIDKRGTSVVYGNTGLEVYVNGELKGIGKYLNFVAGTGITLSFNSVGQRSDITISNDSVTGTILEATGTVNGVNTIFTFTSKPSVIVIDGTPYRETNKLGETIWSWNSGTLTATLTLPPQSDVYGLR